MAIPEYKGGTELDFLGTGTVLPGTGTVPPNPFRYYPVYFGIATRYAHKKLIHFFYIVYRYRKTPQTLPLRLFVCVFGRYTDEH